MAIKGRLYPGIYIVEPFLSQLFSNTYRPFISHSHQIWSEYGTDIIEEIFNLIFDIR